MEKPIAIFNRFNNRFVQAFEYPIQADKYIKKVLGDSPYFIIRDLRKNKR